METKISSVATPSDKGVSSWQTSHVQLPSWLLGNANEVEKYLRSFSEGGEELGPFIVDAFRRGRKLRSALALELPVWAGWEIADKGRERLMACLARIEYLHAASCVIDDIIDGDALRRGVAAFHVRAGVPAALLSSLTMIVIGLTQGAESLPGELRVALASCALRMIRGEAYDSLLIGERKPSEDTLTLYLEKTTPLFELSHRAVAYFAGMSAKEQRRAGEYGSSLGAYYQAANDHFDWFGISPSVRGDASDEVLLTFSLPLSVLLRKRPDLVGMVGKRCARRHLQSILQLMRENDVEEDSLHYLHCARQKVLERFPSSEAPLELVRLLDYAGSPHFWSYEYAA